MEIINAIPVENLKALELIYSCLESEQIKWLVGGSCGLLLQTVPLEKPPRDLDIYVDAKDAALVYQVLRRFATDQLLYSETDIYSSLLSHYRIENVAVELVGGFEVHADQCVYQVEVSELLAEFRVDFVQSNGQMIGLMPLAHELVFNMLRQRSDRFEVIAAKMQTDFSKYLTPLIKIMKRNTFSPRFMKKLNELLKLSL